MKQRLFRTRRLGVALIAGVTALGAAASLGGGVAGAATPTSVTATTAVTTVPTFSGNSQTIAPSAVTIAINGTVSAGDIIDLTLACPAAGSFNINTPGTVTVNSGGATFNTPKAVSNNACGTGNDIIQITAAGTATAAASSITLSGVNIQATSAASGNLVFSGAYVTTTTTTPFSVPTLATIDNVSVTQVPPATSVAPGTANAAINNLSMNVPPAVNPFTTTATYPVDVCVTLPTGINFDTITGAPAVTQSNGASTATVAAVGTPLTGTAGVTAPVVTAGNVAEFQVQSAGNTSATIAPTFLLSNLHVDVPLGTAAGAVNASLSTTTTLPNPATPTSNCTGAAPLVAGQMVFAVSATSGAPIFGTNAEATAAAEFDTAMVKPATATTPVTCNNQGNAILATAADPYDALSASYLEGALHTGVLITPVSTTGTIDPATLQALQYAGVQRVYIVGGPLAVTQAEINQLQSTPAYNCGGLTKTGSNLVVAPALFGQTADLTAAAIANYANTIVGVGTLNLSSAFTSASTYNQTTGNASASVTTVASPKTAIVISDTDWQDADTIAPIAYKYNIPIILTTPNALSATAQSELLSLGINQVIAVGGQLALQPAVVTSIQALAVGGTPISVLRIAGQDYTQTAADIAMLEGKVLGWSQSTLYVAQGTSAANGWGDSLAAAPLAAGTSGAQGGILLTVSPTAGEGQYTDAVLKLAGTAPSGLGSGVTSTLQVLGGPLAVSAATTTSMQNALAGK